MLVRLDNEYVEETEVVETTTTYLKSRTLQKATFKKTTTRNRRNLDNVGRHVINGSHYYDLF